MEVTELRHMDVFSHDELRMLIEQPVGPCVSLFLPIEHSDPARQQNVIRLDNLLRRAETYLVTRGMSEPAAHGMLAPAYGLGEDYAFWLHQADGLAIFVAADLFRTFRLPLIFEERVVVDERAYLAPLLPLLGDDQFYLLTLGLGGVHLFRGSRYTLQPIALDSVPASLQDALATDEFSREAQYYSGPAGHGGAVFYGHGARDGTAVKQEIQQYMQQVDHGVRRVLHNTHAPLLLAGIAYLLPIYRSVNNYPKLLDDVVATNVNDLLPGELHARAWGIISRSAEQVCAAAIERYWALHGATPGMVTSYLRAIIPATATGRVDTLLLAAGQQRWGTYEAASGVLMQHEVAEPGDADLLNLAAVEVLRHGGAVYTVASEQMPDGAPLAAILRY